MSGATAWNGARPDTRVKRLCIISSYVALPGLLALLNAMQEGLRNPITQFLVLPPFAVVIFLLFREPYGPWANVRSIVALPFLGAATGELSYRYLGLSPLGLAATVVVVMVLQDLLRARMPPALALSVLAMLLHVESPTYALGVAEQSATVALAFFLWRRLTIAPLLLKEPLSAATSGASNERDPQDESPLTKTPTSTPGGNR